MRGQEKEEDSPSCVQLLLLGVNLSSSFKSGLSSQSRGARAQRAQLLANTPVHRARASRGAGRQTLTAYASGQIERVGVGARVGVNVVDQTDSESQWRTSIGR